MKRMGRALAIDMGTANTLVYMRGRGIVLREPTVVAVRTKGRREVIAVGEQAKNMLGRAPGEISVVRPMREGVIADYDVTEVMLRYFIKKAASRSTTLVNPRVVITVPCGTTAVERRAVEEAARNAGGRDVTLVDEPVAAAVGAGLDIEAPLGCMIVDIGGGTTEVAALSLGGIVAYRSLRVGGSHLDEAIMEYVRKKHNVMIGERTAEELKIKVGCVYPQPEETRMAVRGRDLFGGLPTLVEVTSSDICQALKEPMQAIVAAVRQTLEQTPPELSGDIMQNGLVISGGSAGLVGLEVLMKEAVRIPVSIADTPQECVALGAGLLIDSMLHNYRAQRRQM